MCAMKDVDKVEAGTDLDPVVNTLLHLLVENNVDASFGASSTPARS